MYAIAARSSDSELGRRAALLRQHRAALLGVLRSRGATNPRIFGSVARGKEREGSDIDLLVDLPEGYSLVDLAGLSLERSELVGEPVDVATPDLLKPDYLKAALKDARPL
jgi:predicted nucleotidyltransferase